MLFDSRMFASSAECLLNKPAQSHMRFFKHKLKMSKTHFFFKWHPVSITYCKKYEKLENL
jgi:hypothetical protein